MSKLISGIFALVLCAGPAFSSPGEALDPAAQRIKEISDEIRKLSPQDREAVKGHLQNLVEFSEDGQWSFRPMSTMDQKLRPFVCAGIQGAAIVSVLDFNCVNTEGTTFEISSVGLRRALIVSGNIAMGYTRGPLRDGLFDVTLEGGVYAFAGLSVYSSPSISLLAPGLGVGFHFGNNDSYASLMGGRLLVKVAKP